jgi:predicted ester cyclase
MPENDTPEQNKAIMRRMLEAFNTGDTAAVADLFDRDIKDRGNRIGAEQSLQAAHPTNRVKTEIMRQEDAFPDREFKEELILAEGDFVMLHWSMTGTHRGELFGRPPTGKRVKTSGTEIIRIKNGKIVEHIADDTGHVLGILMQLDMLDRDLLEQLKTGAPELATGFRTAQ